jgi:hypothetical protein
MLPLGHTDISWNQKVAFVHESQTAAPLTTAFVLRISSRDVFAVKIVVVSIVLHPFLVSNTKSMERLG